MSLYTNLAKRFLAARLPAALRDRQLPFKLTVASTFRCNHECRICGIWRIYRETPEKRKEELAPEDFERIFADLRNSLLFLDWGGGEPFLRQDIVPILESAARICPKLASFVITTNGLLTARVTEAVAELAGNLPDHAVSVGVSLDGEASVHDEIRGKPGAFDAATATIRGLHAVAEEHRNVEVKLSYTLCSLNAGKFGEFHKRVLKPLGLGAGDVGFNLEHVGNLFQTTGSAQRMVGEIAAREFWDGVSTDVRFVLEQVGKERLHLVQRLKSFYRRFFLESIPGYLAQPAKMVIPCEAARNSLYLDPYGNFYPCVVWGNRLGHYTEGIANMLRSEPVRAARRTIDAEKCPVCWNACEAIPSLLTSWRLVGCVARETFGLR